MTDLLKPLSMKSKGKHPLMMEFPVNPETSPYLVSAAGKSKLLWIPNSKGSTVRAGVRYGGDRDSINSLIAKEIALVGDQNGWGNVHPFTQEGLAQAFEYLNYYGFDDLEILSGSATVPFETPFSVTLCNWLDEGCAVIVPKDRSFVGVISSAGNGYAVLVHNPSRGVAILGDL